MQALLPSCGVSSDSSDTLILRWTQIQHSFSAVGVAKILPGLNDEEIVVEQVVLSAEIPPGCFFHLAPTTLTLYEFFTHHASCTLQVQPHGQWPPPNQTSWSSCWASWWKRGTCFIRWGERGTKFPPNSHWTCTHNVLHVESPKVLTVLILGSRGTPHWWPHKLRILGF